MSDGKGCICAAYSSDECGCDADWTPQEVYDLRAEIKRLESELAESDGVFWKKTAELRKVRIDELKAELAKYRDTVVGYAGTDIENGETALLVSAKQWEELQAQDSHLKLAVEALDRIVEMHLPANQKAGVFPSKEYWLATKALEEIRGKQ